MRFSSKTILPATGALSIALLATPASFGAQTSSQTSPQTAGQTQSPATGPTTPSTVGQPGMGQPGAQTAEQNNSNQKMDSGSTKMAKSADTAFAMKAAQGGMAEVQLGKLAQEKGTNPDVKAFGQLMVQDHTKANDELKSVAEQENMTVPATLNAKDQALYNKLQTMSGAAFDKDYIKHMVKDHEMDVKEFKKEASSGTNDKIKNFASTTLPVLEGHLSRAKGIEKQLAGKGSSNTPST